MREMRVVYNPKSRRGRFISKLDQLIEAAQYRGFRVSLHRLSGKGYDQDRLLTGLGSCSVVIACGGDGTLQLVANTLVKHDMDLPVGLLPYGTSNDFADALGLSTDSDRIMHFLDTDNIGNVDLGRIGDKCFVNVFSAGQITKASHEVERVYKDHLGMLAYYLHTVGNLPKIAPFQLTLKGDINESISCLLLLALNSTSAGGFKNLAPKANVNNGTLDLIAIKECSLPEMAGVFLGVLRGEHHNNPSVLYTKVSSLEIHGPEHVETDLDGERGPTLPVKIEVLPGRLSLLGAKL